MPRHHPITATPLPEVDWHRYAPQHRGMIALALEQARRLPHCLFCRRTRCTAAVWLPAEAQTVGGSDARPIGYKLCAQHADATVEAIEARLTTRRRP